mgnify:FL=1
MKYDVIIVGAGPAGYFCAYELMQKNPNLKVILLEKGYDIYSRKCPVLMHKLTKCPVNKEKVHGCHPACAMTNGFGGAGAYSDGKFNITSDFGGWVSEYIDEDELLDLINYVDAINLKYGATETITDPYTPKVREIEKKAIAVGLKLLRARVRHLGTEENLEILKKISADLSKQIEMRFLTSVTDIVIENNECKGVMVQDEFIEGDNVFLAIGREGSKWLASVFENHHIKMINNQVDIGVRVETNDIVMEEINEALYEGKFIFNTSVGTQVRTFCSNPSGQVVMENEAGTILANGHAYKDSRLGSHNTNFALLVSHRFEEPFDRPNDYAHAVARLANQLSCGSVLVQKYGDFLLGRRTTEKRLQDGFVKPTLKEAVPGDLGLCLPYNTMKSIIEMIEALNHITPGIANEHTLLYGVEAKFYSSRPVVDHNLQVKGVKNLYVGGDGAGLTRGLAQAGASGVYVARKICE